MHLAARLAHQINGSQSLSHAFYAINLWPFMMLQLDFAGLTSTAAAATHQIWMMRTFSSLSRCCYYTNSYHACVYETTSSETSTHASDTSEKFVIKFS